MAFFDDLGKKLSQVGQSAAQKTKNMSDSSKIKGLLSDEERNLNNYYLQIGQLYVNTHFEDYEDAFAELMTAITACATRIQEYRQQLQAIKGIVTCEKCGAEIPSNVAFCSSCGAPAPKRPEPVDNTPKCPGCGNAIAEDSVFCPFCGQSLTGTADAVKPASDKCPNCGAELSPGSAFCTGCGTRIG